MARGPHQCGSLQNAIRRGELNRQHRAEADVRFGSKADIGEHSINVRFTPKSGHRNSVVECPLCAKSRHSALQLRTLFSIASSARFSTTAANANGVGQSVVVDRMQSDWRGA